MKKVFLAFDNSMTLDSLRMFLEGEGTNDITEIQSLKGLEKRIAEEKPDFLFIGAWWWGDDDIGLELLSQYKAGCPEMKIVVFSMFPHIRAKALKKGADFALDFEVPLQEILTLVANN